MVVSEVFFLVTVCTNTCVLARWRTEIQKTEMRNASTIISSIIESHISVLHQIGPCCVRASVSCEVTTLSL